MPPKAVDAPAKPTLQEYLLDAAKARADGTRDKARDTWRTAAKVYPTAKEPWLKLSEDYLDATDYGNAILAAQEALVRDGADSTATSVLAVSGLRVSASALQSLRAQSPIVDGTRSEAQNMARTLREVLGEPVLVPTVAAAPTAKPKRRVVPVQPKPADGASVAAANPFDKLK